MKPEIEEFAKLLVREVRDRAVVSCDSQLIPESNSPTAKRWKTSVGAGASSVLAADMIPDCVDDAIFHLLHAIDSGALHLCFIASDGNVVDLTDEGMGELAGWYMMSKDGWRSMFSQERFIDDLASLQKE